jgi:hypothetical protein
LQDQGPGKSIALTVSAPINANSFWAAIGLARKERYLDAKTGTRNEAF